MTPEFSRPERIDAIGEGARRIEIVADEAERAKVAARFGLIAVDALSAWFDVRRDGAGVVVTGRVFAAVVQACSATGDPVPAGIDEPVELRFVVSLGNDEEVELAEDALDTVEIEGGAIDLGEAAAETLALALDPFLRSPNAAAALKAAGVVGEDEVEPFGALAGLKALLGKN